MLNPVRWYRLSRWLFLHKIPFLPRVVDMLNEFVFHSALPHTCEIGEGFMADHNGVGVFVHPRAKIGRNVAFGTTVTVGGRSQQFRAPRIGDNCYIAEGAKVLGDLEIGEGCFIGANAVVLKSVPARCAVAGVPARITKENIDVHSLTGWPHSHGKLPTPRKAKPAASALPSAPSSKPDSTATRPMRLFYFIDSLNLGGSENQMVEVARRLNSETCRITVGVLNSKGPYIKLLRQAGIPVVHFPLPGSLARPGSLYCFAKLALYIRRERFDVVHTHDLWSNLLGVPAAWLARVPAIISSRRDLAHLWWYTPRRRKILRRIQNLGSFVLANAERVRQFLIREEGFRPEKIRVVRNGVDYNRFAYACGDREQLIPCSTRQQKLVIMVGNMHQPEKGHSLLVEAARQICPAIPEVRFVLVGEGQQRPSLEKHVKELGLNSYFLFLGHREDVPELLSCANVSVLPSTAEGLPNSVLEAMAAGVPVVTTNVGGTPEIIEDGVNGLLVPPQDSDALARALLRVLTDTKLAKRLASAAQDRARNQFSFDRVLAELGDLYAESQLKKTARFERAQDRAGKRWEQHVGPVLGSAEEILLATELTQGKSLDVHSKNC